MLGAYAHITPHIATVDHFSLAFTFYRYKSDLKKLLKLIILVQNHTPFCHIGISSSN